MIKADSKTFQYGDFTVTLETNEIARQADSAVVVRMGGTVVLVTVVAAKEAVEGRGFFPLAVFYQERFSAAGEIPGGFQRREGRPSENETLTSRLIDRPLRPLFPKGFINEVQIVATVLSYDPAVDSDIPALIGASAAVTLSGLPFKGPIGAARVGYQDGKYILNPSRLALEDSELNLVVAGTSSAVLMVESEANVLSEEVMLGAVIFGHEQMQVVTQAIQEFAAELQVKAWDWQPPAQNEMLIKQVSELAETEIAEAYKIPEKQQRYEKIAVIRERVLGHFVSNEAEKPSAEEIKTIFAEIEKRTVRARVTAGEKRIDGRDHVTVRPITIKTGILPRTHGSALFTRGETQAIVVATLGTEQDAQLIDDIRGTSKDRFMLHYNFPPYCVGETGMMGSPKRREIGHGRLARRGLEAVLPNSDEFPYVMRVISEITESNGSSSMATVCGSSLALMDAGVPVKAPVAGIAMGLVKENDKFAVLSDILGDEDHLGDMDFKVAGTSEGITALQMDIKIDGITPEIMHKALEQARVGRLHILGKMAEIISQPKTEMSEHAPRIITIKIHPDKIREVIGKGGVTIRSITEETGASIDIGDDGTIKVFSVDAAAGAEAIKRIESITADAEVGKVYEGKVTKIADFGAFVSILPGKEGLVHISQICAERVEKVSDRLTEGQEVKVKVVEIDRQGRIRLSMKEVEQEIA